MSEILWRRLGYMLSPQLDIYRHIAPRVSGLEVLDIGFGTGFGTLQLSRFASRVVGIESDPEAVEFAYKNLPGTWYCRDITMYYEKEVYDAVTMIEVLEHIPEWERAVKNVFSLLRPGGILFISGRNANADLRKNELHEREWKAGEFHAALSKYFDRVQLWDYTLEAQQGTDTRQTPLVAVCYKEEKCAPG
jgi:2-polyprenyl-3-methyl-5-hydroxy-6-metoxy-1,4-benzoquinol methylase